MLSVIYLYRRPVHCSPEVESGLRVNLNFVENVRERMKHLNLRTGSETIIVTTALSENRRKATHTKLSLMFNIEAVLVSMESHFKASL
jgi:hypothetical protein